MLKAVIALALLSSPAFAGGRSGIGFVDLGTDDAALSPAEVAKLQAWLEQTQRPPLAPRRASPAGVKTSAQPKSR